MAEKSSEASLGESSSTPQDERPSGKWWDSWLTSAKSMSAEVYTMVKKDLVEFGTVMTNDATNAFNYTSNIIGKTLKLDEPESPANVMTKSVSTFIGQVSTVLNPEPDDEDDTEVILSSGDTTMLSTYKKELEGLQRVDATFLVAADSAEYSAWMATVEGDVTSQGACARRMRGCPLLAAQYQRLVPDAVSHQDFWHRYLFRVALLQDRLAAAARKIPQENLTADPVLAHLPLQADTQAPPVLESPKKVLSGVESEAETPETSEAGAVAWEYEDFAHDVELTEEQQTLLLEEYEKEIATKKQQKKDTTNNNTKTTSTDTATTKTKSAQTRDKMNNKTDKKKNPKKDNKSPKKPNETDICGNDLVEDYFAEKELSLKDDASANSDESWEKVSDGVLEQKA